MKFQPMEFIDNLKYMGIGMLGVFMIVGIIILASYAIGKYTTNLSKKMTKINNQWGCLIKNLGKSKQNRIKYGENCILGKFLMRTEPGANGFRAEIFG